MPDARKAMGMSIRTAVGARSILCTYRHFRISIKMDFTVFGLAGIIISMRYHIRNAKILQLRNSGGTEV